VTFSRRHANAAGSGSNAKDPRLGVDVFEIENGHSDVRAAVDNERSRVVGLEEVLSLAEDFPLLKREARSPDEAHIENTELRTIIVSPPAK
jgi:hypothetical protein